MHLCCVGSRDAAAPFALFRLSGFCSPRMSSELVFVHRPSIDNQRRGHPRTCTIQALREKLAVISDADATTPIRWVTIDVAITHPRVIPWTSPPASNRHYVGGHQHARCGAFAGRCEVRATRRLDRSSFRHFETDRRGVSLPSQRRHCYCPRQDKLVVLR